MRGGMGKKPKEKHWYVAVENPKVNEFFKIMYIYIRIWKKKKNQELSLLEQNTQPQTEKKQELRAF